MNWDKFILLMLLNLVETLKEVYAMVRDADCPMCLRGEMFGPCVGLFVPAVCIFKFVDKCDQLNGSIFSINVGSNHQRKI